MASAQDLMGLGMPPFLARQLTSGPHTVTAVGATVGSATQIPAAQFLTIVNTGTSSVKVPQIGGDNNALLGLPAYHIVNLTAATIAIYAASNAAGSAVTFYTSAASGILLSCAIGKVAQLVPISVSSWAVVSGASAG